MNTHSAVIMASMPRMERTMQMPRLLRASRGLRRHSPTSHLVSIGRISRLMIYAMTTPMMTGRSTAMM